MRLLVLVPLLLLTIPCWLDRPGRWRWIAAFPLGALGVVIALLQFLVNYWRVIASDHLNVYEQGTDLLFIPLQSQLLAHLRAVLHWDSRVEFWLLEVVRTAGWLQAARVAILLLVALTLALWRLWAAASPARGDRLSRRCRARG